MKRKIYTLLIAATALITLHSCLNSDEEYNTYSDTAITSFKLGTLKRILHTTSSTGADSTYTTTFSASSYVFHIDQLNCLIYNTDSLPLNTVISKCLVTLTTATGGFANWVLENDTTQVYSSTDSIDFTYPRVLRAYAGNGVDYRDYTVTVVAHQEDSTAVRFTQYTTQDAFKNFNTMDAVAVGRTLYLFGADKTSTEVYSTDIFDGNNWKDIATNIMLQPSVAKKVIYSNGYFYAINDNDVIRSANAEDWTTINSDGKLQCIFGASKNELYAVSKDSTIMVSLDGGTTWEPDEIDEAYTDEVPVEDLNCVVQPLETDTTFQRVMLIGNDEDYKYPVIWTKLVNTEDPDDEEEWYRLEKNTMNYSLYLPGYDLLHVFGIEGYMMGLGLNGNNPSCPWFSYDDGITWEQDTLYDTSSSFEIGNLFTAAIDDINRVWIISGKTGQVWTMRQNGVAWRAKEKEAALRKE